MPFSERDILELSQRGISVDSAQRQLELLRAGSVQTVVDRPCTLGDGIVHLSERDQQTFAAAFRAALHYVRVARFVPASGAATRMFAHLRTQGDEPARHAFFAALNDFPFAEQLNAALGQIGKSIESCIAEGDYATVTSVLLDPAYMNYDALPKGSIPFHRYGTLSRTAFEEQLVEAAMALVYGQASEVHFTVPESFAEVDQRALQNYARALNSKLSASFSVQSPHTDTLALTADGEPVRNGDGSLVFRPGGHGALLHNLSALDHDVVFIKNIDNIVIQAHQPWVNDHKSVLGGLLLSLVGERNALLREVNHGDGIREAVAFLSRWFFGDGWSAPNDVKSVAALLDRPIRVCGMVRNTGEPGGGPFWMRSADGRPSVQIIESSQINHDDPSQVEVFRSSTHFNPVDVVCSLVNAEGKPYRLQDFANPNRVIVTQKVHGNEEVRVLELPGLWNGGMENWLTVFVEVPADTFAPVKTVNDLLRPAHRQ